MSLSKASKAKEEKPVRIAEWDKFRTLRKQSATDTIEDLETSVSDLGRDVCTITAELPPSEEAQYVDS